MKEVFSFFEQRSWRQDFFLLKGRKNMKEKKYHWDNRMIARIAIFSALTILLYIVPVFQFKIPSVFPSFLEFHFDEIPVFIAGFAYGPWTAFWVLLIRTLAKLPFTSTVCVGELSDFIYSVVFIIPASIFYKKHHDLKGVILSFAIGFSLQVVVSALCNCYFMIDFYLFLYKGLTAETLLKSCQALNPRIQDIHGSLTLWTIIPFNVLKDLIVILVTFAVYKSIKPLLK